MNKSRKYFTIEEYKIQASILLKSLHRETLNRSDLVILDAQQVDAEPIAIVQ